MDHRTHFSMTALKYLSLSLLFLLCGCTSFSASKTTDTFTPFTPVEEMKSPVAYAVDLNNCRWMTHEYLAQRGGVSPSEIGSKGVQTALGGLQYIPISPYSVPLGGAGGASQELLAELGLNTEEAKKIITDCMVRKGDASGAYHVYDPHQ